MKSKEEIESKLNEIKIEREYAREWYEKASLKYQKDRDYWGKDQADRGEMDAASDALANCNDQIKLLSWVLDIEFVK